MYRFSIFLLALICSIFSAPVWAEEPAPVLEVLGAVMDDGLMNPEEKQFLADWLGLSGTTTKELAGKPYSLSPLTGADRDLVAYIHTPVNLKELWLKDSDKMRLYVRLGQIAPPIHDRLVKFNAYNFYPKWMESNINNGYGPIRESINEYLVFVEPLEKSERREGRAIAYDAMKAVDGAVNDEVPLFIYSWLKTAPKSDAVDANETLQDWVAPEN